MSLNRLQTQKTGFLVTWLMYFSQQLSDLLADEVKRLQDSYPVIKHGRLLQIVRKADLDLDEEELQQVTCIPLL